VVCISTIYRERIVGFPLQQWLCDRATLLCYTYIAYRHPPTVVLLRCYYVRIYCLVKNLGWDKCYHYPRFP